MTVIADNQTEVSLITVAGRTLALKNNVLIQAWEYFGVSLPLGILFQIISFHLKRFELEYKRGLLNELLESKMCKCA